MKQEFEAKLIARGPKGAWTHVVMPFPVEKVFGSKARVPVKGAINGFPFRTSIMPEGGGTHSMAVTKAMQQGAGAAAGDTVHVVLSVDTEKRTVEVPDELRDALRKSAQGESAFAALGYSHRKEFVDWINEARRPETRAARVEKTLNMIAVKKRPKG